MENQTPRDFMNGLIMVTITVLFWGILPIALVFTLSIQDGTTITWFRFLVAAILCLTYQAAKGRLHEFTALSAKEWAILAVAAALLISDYMLYIYGLNYIDPSAMQVFSQATPLFLALGGIFFFKERISWFQGACFLALFVGLGLFFNASITKLSFEESGFLTGVLIAVTASFVWAIYALLQKRLVAKISSANILLFIYVAAVFLLLPASDLGSFHSLTSIEWGILSFCALNTLVAYYSFSEALNYWPTTHVSSALALVPLATIFASYGASKLWPTMIPFPELNILGWTGVFLTLTSMILFNLRKA
ncbi:MAG: DMT family transporter [Kordiimonas sp.]